MFGKDVFNVTKSTCYAACDKAEDSKTYIQYAIDKLTNSMVELTNDVYTNERARILNIIKYLEEAKNNYISRTIEEFRQRVDDFYNEENEIANSFDNLSWGTLTYEDGMAAAYAATATQHESIEVDSNDWLKGKTYDIIGMAIRDSNGNLVLDKNGNILYVTKDQSLDEIKDKLANNQDYTLVYQTQLGWTDATPTASQTNDTTAYGPIQQETDHQSSLSALANLARATFLPSSATVNYIQDKLAPAFDEDGSFNLKGAASAAVDIIDISPTRLLGFPSDTTVQVVLNEIKEQFDATKDFNTAVINDVKSTVENTMDFVSNTKDSIVDFTKSAVGEITNQQNSSTGTIPPTYSESSSTGEGAGTGAGGGGGGS